MSYTNDPYHQQPDPQPFVNHPYATRPIVPMQPSPPYGIEPLPSPFPVSAPPRRDRKPGRLLLITGFAATALASCGIGAALANSTASTPTAATVLPAVTVTVTQAAIVTTPSPSSTKPPTIKTVLSLHGSGIKNTAKFTTGDNWTIHYTYNCAGFGGKGNFAVTTYTGGELDDVVVNDLGRKGDSTAPVYDAPGSHYLSINSECSWTIKVTA